jgi:hypothetical protein
MTSESEEWPELRPIPLAAMLGSLEPLGNINAQLAKMIGEVFAPRIRTAIGIKLTKQLANAIGLNATMRQALEPLNDQLRERWRELFASFDTLAARLYPANLRDVRPSRSELEQVLLDEGIPLIWVPGPKVVRALLDAPDAATRRRIIGRRWKGIVNDCEAATTGVDHPDLQTARGFALDCVAALRAGHANPAQALAANLVDSLLRAHLNEADRKRVTLNKKGGARFDLSDYGIRVALTFAPVWYAHAAWCLAYAVLARQRRPRPNACHIGAEVLRHRTRAVGIRTGGQSASK